MTDRMAIVGAAVVTPQEVISDGVVLCEGGRIVYVGPGDGMVPEPDSLIIDADGSILMPGFIDTHFHGSGGDDVMAGGAEGLGRIAQSVLRFGTTGFLATTIAARHEELLRSIEATLEEVDVILTPTVPMVAPLSTPTHGLGGAVKCLAASNSVPWLSIRRRGLKPCLNATPRPARNGMRPAS